MGQNSPHWVRFLVSVGSTTTSPANSETKITAWIAVRVEVTSLYSVTVLNGHSHSQYAGERVAAERITTAASTAYGRYVQ